MDGRRENLPAFEIFGGTNFLPADIFLA